jgi:phage head maturation protease
MANGFVIRGYGCLFNSEAVVAGVREHVVPGAFWGLSMNCEIRWGTHDGYVLAKTRDGSGALHQDARGLGFEATLWTDSAGAAAYRAILQSVSRRSDGPFQASVWFEEMQDQTYWGADGVLLHRRITSARVSHIAIVSCGAAYSDTQVWPDIPLDELPRSIAAMARDWETGRDKYVREQKLYAKRGAALLDRRSRSGPAARERSSPAPHQAKGLTGRFLTDETLTRHVASGRLSKTGMAHYVAKRQRLQQQART